MVREVNKALIRRWAEVVLSKGDLTAIDELFAANYIDHTNLPDWPSGIAGYKRIVTLYHSAFPDFRFTIEQEIAEGDMVVVRGSYRMTPQGEFFGIPPIRKQATTSGMHLFRIVDGKIVEHWCNNDDLGVMRQLGVIP